MRRARGRAACLVVVGAGALLVLAADAALADRLWTVQLKGGSVVLALDRPEERGSAVVFHRHPDALYASLRASEVVRITSADGPPKKVPKSLDGQILVFGRDADPPEQVAMAPPPPPPPDPYAETAPAPYSAGLVYFSPRRHHHPRHPPPSMIGPNGFPILNPTFMGTPTIGPNGFPILAPTPPRRF
jgi:hypothetical protein